jgi:hypothetical protein
MLPVRGKACGAASAGRAPLRRVYMSFMDRKGWYCQFLEADLQTALPRKFNFAEVGKVRELAKRAGGLPDLAAVAAFDHAVSIGRGGVWLSLTQEQYAKLKTKG